VKAVGFIVLLHKEADRNVWHSSIEFHD